MSDDTLAVELLRARSLHVPLPAKAEPTPIWPPSLRATAVSPHTYDQGRMGVVRIRPDAEIRVAAEPAFEEHRQRVLEMLPEAHVDHVGSTSIPGALTKGDAISWYASTRSASTPRSPRSALATPSTSRKTGLPHMRASSTRSPRICLSACNSRSLAPPTTCSSARFVMPSSTIRRCSPSTTRSSFGTTATSTSATRGVRGEFVERVLARAKQSSPR